MEKASAQQWSVEFPTPLSAKEAVAHLQAVTDPWPSALSKHVGAGGRVIHGDTPGARRFEGDISRNGFKLQRIHYRGESHGPRIWSIGEIVDTPSGATVRIAYRLRNELYIRSLLWATMLLGLTLLATYLGLGERLYTFLFGAFAIFVLGMTFFILGFRMEQRLCTALFRALLDGKHSQQTQLNRPAPSPAPHNSD